MLERLQKIIAAAGLASRRESENWIQSGLVTVNGRVVDTLGAKADPDHDAIKVKGKLINPQLAGRKLVYYLLNKPKGYLSSLSDPEQRPLVTSLLPKDAPRVHPVGRLDFNTEGLLILTNDGALTNLVTKAGDHCPKVYHVKVKGSPSPDQLERLHRGLTIDGEFYQIARLTPINHTDHDNTWYELVLHEGKNNQIRRMFDAIGHSVVKLRRVAIGHLTDAGLPVGAVRELTEAEVRRFFSKRKIAPRVTTRKLGKPRPTGEAKSRQRDRLAATIGKTLGKPVRSTEPTPRRASNSAATGTRSEKAAATPGVTSRRSPTTGVRRVRQTPSRSAKTASRKTTSQKPRRRS
ncbi:MAG: pseudouridine synthase [Chloracidobacterium sp.]|uniref:Pseudouridine synthase n=1 Tax=Chloracidobacterium validum TaxID=2821543 RepID=A0ABX8BEW9_9BACT|nr:pseudouridine synthase [Chloracidobacterium validum]QUW04551.1 rRNA pseudouridine synthase [Chloracidobacterium validum]